MERFRIWGSNGTSVDVVVSNCSLSVLVPRLKEHEVQLIIDRLSQFTDASNQNAELRDISSTGTSHDALTMTKALRTVISEIPSNTPLSHILISRLLPRLQAQVSLL